MTLFPDKKSIWYDLVLRSKLRQSLQYFVDQDQFKAIFSRHFLLKVQIKIITIQTP